MNDDRSPTNAKAALPLYEIETDPERGLIEFTLRGEWDDAIVDEFVAAYRPMVAAMEATGGVRYSLVNALDYGELTTAIADRFPPVIMSAKPRPDKRTAIVLSDSVKRARARTVANMVDARYFNSVDAAKEWLFSDEA
jgi:hypothetical protein